MLFIFFALFSLQYHLIVSLEEERLRQHFGQIYEVYLSKVPRFIPRLRSFRSQNRPAMPLRRALKIEKNTLFSVFFAALAIFLRWKFGMEN
jgi:hypothetical protein